MKIKKQDEIIFKLLIKHQGVIRDVLNYLEREENIEDDDNE